MPTPLVFMMGRSPAILPTDRLYSLSHYWAVAAGAGFRLGLTSYAVKLLGDLRQVSWSVTVGERTGTDSAIGYIEGSKATSDLYAPIEGAITAINPGPPATPVVLNTNPYDDGWLLEIAGNGERLVTAQQYLAHLEAAWPLAQRLLKGQ